MVVRGPESDGDTPVAVSRASLGGQLNRLLRQARHAERGGLKVSTIAGRINVSPASLYAYLAGATLPPIERLDDLLTELKASDDERRRLHELRDEVEARFPAKPRPDVAGAGPPVIEIVLPDGTVEVADIEDARTASSDDRHLTNGYEIEELAELIHVDSRRTIPRVDCRRRIRAVGPDVRRFSYSAEFPPDSGLRRVVVDATRTATVSKVIRVSESAYIFHFDLPAPLGPGETYELLFSVLAYEDESHEDRDVYGKRQFVATGRVDLSIDFAAGARPVRVRWFAEGEFPLGNFPGSFDFPEENTLQAAPDGRYRKTFEHTELPPGRIFGLVWDYT